MDTSTPTPTAPPAHRTVNDVSAPAANAAPAAPEQPAPAADLSVHEEAAVGAKTETGAQDHDQPAPPAKVKQPKEHSPRPHGTGMAILAATVIILGLGALFTYAYLRSQNIALF